MSLKRVFLALLLFFQASAKEIKVAITFDDFPMGSTLLFKKKERVEVYMDKLDKLNVQAVFFCIGEQLDSLEGKECLNLVRETQFLANHSYSHPNLSKISLEKFQKELEQTESLLSSRSNYRKWYRFPYLDYGDRENIGGTDEKRIKAFHYLKKNGYKHGYVTINTFDWYVDSQLKKALAAKKNVDWEKLKKAYLDLVQGWIDESHEKWSRSLKNEFVHVLLFHQNDLNAFFLEEIVEMIRKKNWTIVSAEEAFSKPIRYLAYFPNSKGRLFKKPFSLTLEAVDRLLAERQVFSETY